MNYRKSYTYDLLHEAEGARKGLPVEVAGRLEQQIFDAKNAPSTVGFRTRTQNMNYAAYMASLHSASQQSAS